MNFEALQVDGWAFEIIGVLAASAAVDRSACAGSTERTDDAPKPALPDVRDIVCRSDSNSWAYSSCSVNITPLTCTSERTTVGAIWLTVPAARECVIGMWSFGLSDPPRQPRVVDCGWKVEDTNACFGHSEPICLHCCDAVRPHAHAGKRTALSGPWAWTSLPARSAATWLLGGRSRPLRRRRSAGLGGRRPGRQRVGSAASRGLCPATAWLLCRTATSLLWLLTSASDGHATTNQPGGLHCDWTYEEWSVAQSQRWRIRCDTDLATLYTRANDGTGRLARYVAFARDVTNGPAVTNAADVTNAPDISNAKRADTERLSRWYSLE
jgi:hypothetical protein